MPIYIFYHLFCISDSHLKFEETYNRIKRSGLFDITSKIYVILVGPKIGEYLKYLQNFEKVVCHVGHHHGSERSSLDLIWDVCQTGDFKLLYLHSKGVTFGTNYRPDTTDHQVQCVASWKNYMEYFTIDRHERCLYMLNEHDLCGVELTTYPRLHYSGNFWWANSPYVRTLQKFDSTRCTIPHSNPERVYCEFWIADTQLVRAANLHYYGSSMYNNIYSEHNYV
jgi:hypothetical protein